MEIPFIGGAYRGRSLNLNAQVCQNLFPVMDQQGGKAVLALMGTPGLTLFTSTASGEVRGADIMGDYLYAIVGSAVYKVTTAGVATAMTGALLTSTGKCWMRNNGLQIAICDGTYYYLLEDSTVTQVTIFNFESTETNLITNGTFDSDIVGWDDKSSGTSCSIYWAYQWAKMAVKGFGAGYGYAQQEIATTAGYSYRLTFDAINWDWAFTIRIGTTDGGAEISATDGHWGSNSVEFVATGASTFIGFKRVGTGTILIDDISLKTGSGESLPNFSSLTYQDGYFILSEKDSGRFYITALYEGKNIDALDYSVQEAHPDNLAVIVSAQRELWLIGTESYEIWYNSGNSDFPFERMASTFNKIGTLSPASVCEYQGTVVWLDHARQVRMSSGYQAQVISTPQIDYQIGSLTTFTDAIAYIYSQEGHTFYVLTFPTEGKTFSFDFTTQFWHTRASDSTDLRHRGNCCAFFNGWTIVGDYTNGNLYKYDLAEYTDNATMLRRIRSAQPIHNDRKRVFHSSFEVEFEAGTGLAVDHPTLLRGIDPQAILQWSDDDGHTWSNEHWTTIGAMGQYKNRAIWRRLGQSRSRIYKVTVTDPVKVVMIGAHLEANGGSS